MTVGYDHPLYVLPFDHRGTFQKNMFGWSGTLNAEQTAKIAEMKTVIYDGFKEALAKGVPQDKAGILVDEQFGAEILRDAAQHGYNTACPAEKSGQDEFDFEYGEDFAGHIERFRPTFCKVLVRYNPEGDATLNRRQAERLKRLSDYLHSGGPSKFMFELLVPGEKAQLEKVGGDKKKYDLELRPGLMIKAIHQLQDIGRRARRLEDRGHRLARGLQEGRRGDEARRPRQGRRHHPGPRRGRREGPTLAQDGRRRPGLHRLRRGPHHVLGSLRRVEGRQADP